MGRRYSKYLEVVTAEYPYVQNRNINKLVEYEQLKVEVSIVFLGTQGFSARREGRYKSILSLPDDDLAPILDRSDPVDKNLVL